MRKKLFFESSLITILSFIILWLFFLLITISFEPFNYVVNSISAIDLNDLYFSSLDNDNVDTNIVVVNIGDADREQINKVLEKVANADPAVIGLDVFFSKYLVTPFDSILQSTLNKRKDKLVLVSNYESGSRDNNYWNIDRCTYGHAGILTTKDKSGVVREFEPKVTDGNTDVYSFSALVARKFDIISFKNLEKRDNEKEAINYLGSGSAFLTINYNDIIDMPDGLLGLVKNRIVFVGYCGDRTQRMVDFTDAYFTPVGATMSVNRLPDMYGVIVHANITSMILRGNYIYETPMWIVLMISLILSFFMVVLLTWVYLKYELYFNIVAKVIQLLGLVLVLWIVFLLFSWFHIKFATSYILIVMVVVADVMLLYESLAIIVYKKFNIRSLFVIENR